ncbi:extracellular solute-binding protein [Paenibacillus sp. S-38]|uniref:extracellular solute-binding protein n=1 Tax=Paenibacillus sp. S-38 TaxID=3416710 RepID=UPI003CEA36D4
MNSMIKRGALLSLSVLMTMPLAACMDQGGKDKDTPRTLRIGTMNYTPDDEWFRQRFTELYEFANKNITIEMVPLMDESVMYGPPKEGEKQKSPMEMMKEKMTGPNPPDVVMVNFEQMPELIENNLLKQLDPMITKDKFDTSDYVPAVIEGIKKAGDGKIFALAPLFSSSALVYNKKLFDEAGVTYPTDKMTWDQVFDLARRVAKGEGKDRKYGFSFSTYNSGDNNYYASQIYSAPLQLKMFDDAGEKMTVDSDQWEKVWKTIQGLQTEKLTPEPVDQEKMRQAMMAGNPEEYMPYQGDDFLSSKVAMAVINYHQIDQIANAMKHSQNMKNFTPFDWDVVTLPVHPEEPNVGGSIYMEGLMAVNSNAQNPDDAWDFVKFVNGEDWARLKSGGQNSLVARQKYIKQKDGAEFNIKAFTTLLPVSNPDNSKLYTEKPYIGQVAQLGQMKFQEVVSGKLQVREALKQWQTEGDAMLQKLKENPNAQIDMGMGK